MPSRSQWAYHRSGSTFPCLRSTSNPSRFIVAMSCTIASSDGAVIIPSDQ